jgi:N-acetylmuramoyl-L-alanine amidase
VALTKKVLILITCSVFIISGCSSGREKYMDDSGVEETEIQIMSNQLGMNIDDTEQTSENNEVKTVGELAGKIIVVDAGHGKNSYNKQEAIAPNTNETKPAFATGTQGVNQTEEQLNLIVALKLQAELEKLGAEVHMTRTEHETDMTNIDRAEFANKLNADLSVKIHADGSNDSSVHGVSVLVPGSQYISDSDILNKSRRAGDCVLEEFINATESLNRGISVRNDLTGFNWTTVPIILVEMGFMTNPDEDGLMETDDYQNKIVKGIANGIIKYFLE